MKKYLYYTKKQGEDIKMAKEMKVGDIEQGFFYREKEKKIIFFAGLNMLGQLTFYPVKPDGTTSRHQIDETIPPGEIVTVITMMEAHRKNIQQTDAGDPIWSE